MIPTSCRTHRCPCPTCPPAWNWPRPKTPRCERPHELRYQHFGVLYSARNKGPAVTAFNIDGSQFRAIKRHNRSWFHDLRIPRDIQLDREDYGHAKIDRGHMVRRFATNWGTEDEAKRARISTATTTPMPARSTPRSTAHARNGWGLRITSSTAPAPTASAPMSSPARSTRRDDPELGNTGAPLPLHFWKVVSMLTRTIATKPGSTPPPTCSARGN